MIKVTVWNEYGLTPDSDAVKAVYPEGIHAAIGGLLSKEKDFDVKTAVIADKGQGVTDEILAGTDVLIWWGHIHHDKVTDENAARIADCVRKGMGVIFLHSAHVSKPFLRLMGTSGRLQWREANESERIWTINPAHPIAAGIPDNFLLEQEEMYGEPFGIPEPDETVFIGWFKGGNVFRSGVTFRREAGKIFYFQPGHETHNTFKNPNVQQIIINAVRWANPVCRLADLDCPNVTPLEKIN